MHATFFIDICGLCTLPILYHTIPPCLTRDLSNQFFLAAFLKPCLSFGAAQEPTLKEVLVVYRPVPKGSTAWSRFMVSEPISNGL